MSDREVIGLIPAAGKAIRIAPLPCSKELFPVGFSVLGDEGVYRPKVVSHYLLEKFKFAGISKVHVVLRKGKWDIPEYYGDGSIADIHISYHIMNLPYGVPYTIDQAFPFIKDESVAFGFPDILFRSKKAFTQLLERQSVTGDEIVLGLFPGRENQTADFVEIDGSDRVVRIFPKTFKQDKLEYAWIIAVWNCEFTRFMHEYLIDNLREKREGFKRDGSELYFGEVFQSAIDSGFHIGAVLFQEDEFIDIGDSGGLVTAVRSWFDQD